MSQLPDIQRTVDTREVPIHRVGVTGIKLPIQVRRAPSEHNDDPTLEYLDTVGTFELACSLPATVKGTHMSRFTEVLNDHVGAGGVFSIEDLQEVAETLTLKLDAQKVFLRLVVDYFINQPAPQTSRPGVAPLKGILQVEVDIGPRDGVSRQPVITTHTGVIIQGKTCCPCSKEISDFDATTGRGKGAHAQRSTISMLARHSPTTTLWFEELVHAAWRSFSSPIYPVLKRPDERAVTMKAYENPKFVEDVVRDVALQLREMPKVKHFSVRVQNEESIHYHDAYAELEEGA